MHNLLTVRFYHGESSIYDWLSLSPRQGTVPPYSNSAINISFNTSGLNRGIYAARLKLVTNDYEHLINFIPVRLNIGQVGTDDPSEILPDEFAVTSIYPNPFNAYTAIDYTLPQSGKITIDAFNLLGQRAGRLYEGFQAAGRHSYTWQADGLASGPYWVRLGYQNQVAVSRVILLK